MAQTISKVGLEMSYIILGVLLLIVVMQINNGWKWKLKRNTQKLVKVTRVE